MSALKRIENGKGATMKTFIKQVEEAVTAWPDFAAKASLPQAEIDRVGAHLLKRPV